MELLKIYQYALQREHEGKRFFEQNGARLSHAAAVEAFKVLAEEEGRHIEFIQAQIDALNAGEPANLALGHALEAAGFFADRAATEAIEQTVQEAMVPDLPVLRLAYLIERDFAEFYEGAAAKVEGDGREVLLALANWERGHERLFKAMHDEAFERYADMPWGG
jgi:rubrerythrin